MQEESRPVQASRAREHLQRLLDEVTVKTACAIGVVNLFKGGHTRLEHPRFFIQAGRIVHELPNYVRPDMAATTVFAKSEYSLRGTSGLISYDISGTEWMVVVQWMMPFSETLFDNRFYVGLMKQQELDESLYHDLNSKSHKPDEAITQEHEGFIIHGTMTKAAKAIIFLECRDNKEAAATTETEAAGAAVTEEDKPKQSQQVQAGPQLQERLHEWLRTTDIKCVCAIGVNNYTSDFVLTNPEMFVDTGRCEFAPPERTDSNMAAPALFTKTQYSLRGSSGVLTYCVGEHHKLAVLWMIPLSETLHANVFNARILPFSTVCDHDLYQSMRAGAQQAKNGELRRHEEGGFEIEAAMETDSKCTLIVNLRHRKHH